MDDTDSVASLIDSTSSKIKQLQKAFAELESHRAVALNLKWKELEEHFHGLEKSLKRRFHELEDQEKKYESKTRKALEILEKREAEVVAKENASLERLQEKRDAAIFAFFAASEKHRKVSTVQVVEPVNVIYEYNCASPKHVETPDVLSPLSRSEESKLSSEIDGVETMSYPQLVKMCEEMDSDSLLKFISDNRKNLSVLREEIPIALKAASDPSQFVLNSLKDFYSTELSNADGKKDSNLLGIRRTCIMLMECLSTLLTCSDVNTISSDVKNQAKAIAEEWKPLLKTLDIDASSGNSLEAHAFLQLLATFGIASGFDKDIICRFIPMVSRRRQAAELCRYLGLTEKMPGVIQVLINGGRHIDAVNLAFAFELTELFSPISLLKAYLKDARKVASSVKPGSIPAVAQNDAINERELSALKSVIRCIEEHKLEEHYPLEPLQKRLILLEKAKEDKKRATETAKPQPKRPRASAVACAPRPNINTSASYSANTNFNVSADKNFHGRAADRYPQYGYERPYVYQGPVDNHVPHLMSSATYSFGPSLGNYYANGYQYPTAYLH